MKKVYTKFGPPARVLTDKGTHFLSKLISKICILFKIKQIKTTSYHPQTDGLVERFNRTLCDMLACYVNDEPESWDKYLDFATFAACYLSIVFTPILTLNIHICDYSKPVTRGLLDLTDPDYCFKNHTDKEDEQKVMSKLVTYYVATKIQTDLRVEGLVCSQWIETKKITGSFWVGSYDTEHFHTTKEVSPQECWEMKSLLNCAGNKNIVNGKTYS